MANAVKLRPTFTSVAAALRGRVETRHDGRDQSREDEAPEADREQLAGQHGEDEIGVVEVWKQQDAKNPRQNHDEKIRELQQSGQERTLSALVQIPRPEGALHDELVQRPVVEAEQDDAQQARPRQKVVARGLDEAHLARTELRRHRVPSAHCLKAEDKNGPGPYDEQDGLHGIGHDDSLKPTEDGVDARDERQHRHGGPEGKSWNDIGDHDPARVQRPGRVDKHDGSTVKAE